MMFFSQRLIREEWEALEKKEREEEEKRERARRGKEVGSVSRWTLCFFIHTGGNSVKLLCNN